MQILKSISKGTRDFVVMRLRRYRRNYKEQTKEVYAAIDLGTNSCRLLIGKFEGQLKIVDSYSKVVRLGENVYQTNMLNEDAINRSLKSLAICMDKIHHNKVTHLRAVTTEACRRAKNSSILVDRTKDELGLDLEIITSEEEALLALSGCSGIFQKNITYGLAFDIGGGSTEVMWVKILEDFPNFEILDWISLPFGVVTLSDAYASYATSPRIYEQVKEKIKTELTRFSEKNNIEYYLKNKLVQMVGTSGTVTTLAAIHLRLAHYDRHLIDGIYLKVDKIKEITQTILHMPARQRNMHPCIGVGRSDLVVTGSAILEGICEAWPLTWIRVADRGVREGILLELIRKHHSL